MLLEGVGHSPQLSQPAFRAEQIGLFADCAEEEPVGAEKEPVGALA